MFVLFAMLILVVFVLGMDETSGHGEDSNNGHNRMTNSGLQQLHVCAPREDDHGRSVSC